MFFAVRFKLIGNSSEKEIISSLASYKISPQNLMENLRPIISKEEFGRLYSLFIEKKLKTNPDDFERLQIEK